ncbi:unnamed protein product [Cuscuta campestris]|uniref:Retrotransposon gag domain-containing protein n=1 Tax=Cuscuta campestris TaxID=132261 RepID=A0A484K321_9ASTE|nr:unnamed protein product [Cuscuta campestris]
MKIGPELGQAAEKPTGEGPKRPTLDTLLVGRFGLEAWRGLRIKEGTWQTVNGWDTLTFYFYQGLTVPSKKELDHSNKLGSFLEMTPEENEELVERLTSNAKYSYEDRALPPKAGMYEIDQFTTLKASMERPVKQTIKEHLGASHSHPNLYAESVNQAELYGSGSHHQSDLVLSCEHCFQNHLSCACPLIEPPPPSKAKDVNLAQYANKGEGPWAQNNQEHWQERNNFPRNNHPRDDYKQGNWNNNKSNYQNNNASYVPPHNRQPSQEDSLARMEKMMMEYMQKMNNLADDFKERDKTRDNQLQQVFKQLEVREQGNLPATTEPNPREQLRTITLRSGKEFQGPEVEADVEEVPVDTSVGASPKKKTESAPHETRKEGTSSSQSQPTRQTQQNTIPFPTTVKKSQDEKAFQKFLDVIGQVEVKMALGFQLTVSNLATHLGLYTWEEMSAPEFDDAPYLLFADVDPADFWAEHSSDPDHFDSMGRARFWIQPTWGILYFVLSTSFFGRPLNTDRVYPNDMIVFWSLHTRREANVAVFMARFLYSQSMGNRTHIVCEFVVTILFRSLVGSTPIPQPQMLTRDLDAGMLRNAHIHRTLGSSSTESNNASSSTPSTLGASLQVSSRRATCRRPTTSQTPAATTQADPIPDWAKRIMEQQETIMQRMSEIGQQHASQAEIFTHLQNILVACIPG